MMHSCIISSRPASWRLVKLGSVFPMREKRINSRDKTFTGRVWFGGLKLSPLLCSVEQNTYLVWDVVDLELDGWVGSRAYCLWGWVFVLTCAPACSFPRCDIGV